MLQEVTKFKDEVIETNLALTVDNDINAVIPKSFQIMDKLDKCHKERTQFNGPGEPKLENQIVKAIHFALLQVAIQKFRLDNEIMADKLEDSVATIKFLGDLHKVFDEIGHGTCSRQEFNFKTCFDVDVQDQKNSRKWARMGIHVLVLTFFFLALTNVTLNKNSKDSYHPFGK